MKSNHKLKQIDFENRIYYYLDDIIKNKNYLNL